MFISHGSSAPVSAPLPHLDVLSEATRVVVASSLRVGERLHNGVRHHHAVLHAETPPDAIAPLQQQPQKKRNDDGSEKQQKREGKQNRKQNKGESDVSDRVQEQQNAPQEYCMHKRVDTRGGGKYRMTT